MVSSVPVRQKRPCGRRRRPFDDPARRLKDIADDGEADQEKSEEKWKHHEQQDVAAFTAMVARRVAEQVLAAVSRAMKSAAVAAWCESRFTAAITDADWRP
jgi:hypothetical protein